MSRERELRSLRFPSQKEDFNARLVIGGNKEQESEKVSKAFLIRRAINRTHSKSGHLGHASRFEWVNHQDSKPVYERFTKGQKKKHRGRNGREEKKKRGGE